jgi:hypothetical protein
MMTPDEQVVLVGVPGAFTPTCSEKHLPGYVEAAKDFKGAWQSVKRRLLWLPARQQRAPSFLVTDRPLRRGCITGLVPF